MTTATAISSETIADLYGLNWAHVTESQRFFDRLDGIVADDFEWRAEKSPAPSQLSYNALRGYVQAIEEDFRVFAYDAVAIEEAESGWLVRGTLEAVSRLSREPFRREVTHIWVGNGDGLAAVESIDS